MSKRALLSRNLTDVRHLAGTLLMKLTTVFLADDNKSLNLGWSDGSHTRFHAIWLRDNGLDAKTRSPANGQRLITVLEIPTDTTITDATITGDGALSVLIAPEMKNLTFSAEWLKHHAYDRVRPVLAGWLDSSVTTWNADFQDCYPTGHWGQISQSRDALGEWLGGIQQYGFAVLSGMPIDPNAVCDVAELFGYVRETNYGRRFDVRADVNPDNLANTNLGLQAHTDNPYRDPAPTLQLLACLENSVEGGESIVVDGFQAAIRLRSECPEAFHMLSKHRAAFEYAGSGGVQLQSTKPMIELSPDGEIITISFNNRSAAPFAHIPFDEMEAYYDAYRRLATIMEDEAMQVTFRLQPGEMFIVDNTRVLHARKAFSGTGQRWLQGCYADKDGLLSTLRVIQQDQESQDQQKIGAAA